MAAKKASTKAPPKAGKGFTAEERAAMRERVRELRAASDKTDGEQQVKAKIAEMRPSDRRMAERIHAIVKAQAPHLVPRTWYGMPAYSKGERVICFFRPAEKFGTRYATFGFSDEAKLDEGPMWPTDFALTELSAAEEARIAELVKRAVS